MGKVRDCQSVHFDDPRWFSLIFEETHLRMDGILSFAKWVMTSFRDLNKQRSQNAKYEGKNSNEI